MNNRATFLAGTASFWLSAAGVGAAVDGKRKTAGTLLLLVGFGYLGVLHERISACRLANYRKASLATIQPRELAWHLVPLVAGWRLLTKEKEA